MRLRSSATFLALAVSLALPGALQAQGRDVFLLPVPPEPMGSEMGRAQPGIGASSPMGFGPSRGDVFAGVSYQSKSTAGTQDGSISVGGGFLSGNELFGIEAVLTSLSTVRSGFGSRMTGSFKVHKMVNNWGLGLGLESVYLNGNEFDTEPSVYLAGTRVFDIRDAKTFSSGSFNIGLGNGRYQNAEDLAAGKSGIGFFVSSSIRVNEFSSAIMDFNSGQMNLALSFAPLQSLPLVVTTSMSDITGEAGDRARLSLGAGMSWKY